MSGRQRLDFTKKERQKMKIKLNRYFVEFNNVGLGIAAGNPRFIIEPEIFAVSPDGGCCVDRAVSVTVQMDILLLDSVFAGLLDRHGRLRERDSRLFDCSGTVFLQETSGEGDDGHVLRMCHARLKDDFHYDESGREGSRLTLSFVLPAPVSGDYLELL